MGARRESCELTLPNQAQLVVKLTMIQCMEKGLRNILNLASSHSRTNSNRHSKISTGSENDQYLRDRSEREDSGIAFAAGESSSRRSSHSNGGAMPTFNQILQHPRHQ
jgi:hypothetical protein